MIIQDPVHGAIVECDAETGKKLIDSGQWVKYAAPAAKKAEAAAPAPAPTDPAK